MNTNYTVIMCADGTIRAHNFDPIDDFYENYIKSTGKRFAWS